jgi:ABC-2 type transport system permease protein
MRAVFLRELKAYFTTPIGFIFVGSFLLLSGILFAVSSLINANSNYNTVQSMITIAFPTAVPILTMRLLAEEMRQKTDQLLITSSLSIGGIVVGKYLAAVCVFLLALVITAIYPVIMSFFAVEGLAGWEIANGYLGFFLLGCSFIALGLFFSSLTDNQFIAAVETFAALLFFWMLDTISVVAPASAAAGGMFLALVALGLVLLVFFSTRSAPTAFATGLFAAGVIAVLAIFRTSFFTGLLGRFLNWISLLKRYEDFTRGILSLSPIVYYLSFCGVFLFLTMQMIEKRRWV